MTIVCVFGTRPEAVKVGPVVAALRTLGVSPVVLSTGQHTTLLNGTPAETDLRDAVSLDLPSDGNVPKWLTHGTAAIRRFLQTQPDETLVVVQGDTMSALAGARAANAEGLRVAHLEAGVRSHDLDQPWPEEQNRCQITALAAWHYAATSDAYANLLAEGVQPNRIRVTGNSGVSALARYTDAVPIASPQPHVVITMHRREWLDSPDFVSGLEGFSQGAAAHPELKFVWPVHPGALHRLPMWARPKNFELVEPLAYGPFSRLLAAATGVLTDSGGVQEDAATLGVPCICLRRVTDRPESIAAGVAERLNPDVTGMAQGIELLAQGRLPRRPSATFGDVTAADQIARHLVTLDRG